MSLICGAVSCTTCYHSDTGCISVDAVIRGISFDVVRRCCTACQIHYEKVFGVKIHISFPKSCSIISSSGSSSLQQQQKPQRSDNLSPHVFALVLELCFLYKNCENDAQISAKIAKVMFELIFQSVAV